MRLVIRDMLTWEDYNIITKELKKDTGIKSIAPFTDGNILKITYWPSRYNIENTFYLIGRLGYRIVDKRKKLKSADLSKRRG